MPDWTYANAFHIGLLEKHKTHVSWSDDQNAYEWVNLYVDLVPWRVLHDSKIRRTILGSDNELFLWKYSQLCNHGSVCVVFTAMLSFLHAHYTSQTNLRCAMRALFAFCLVAVENRRRICLRGDPCWNKNILYEYKYKLNVSGDDVTFAGQLLPYWVWSHAGCFSIFQTNWKRDSWLLDVNTVQIIFFFDKEHILISQKY
jgi:hypothetical protein